MLLPNSKGGSPMTMLLVVLGFTVFLVLCGCTFAGVSAALAAVNLRPDGEEE